jgi:hypothetical protein
MPSKFIRQHLSWFSSVKRFAVNASFQASLSGRRLGTEQSNALGRAGKSFGKLIRFIVLPVSMSVCASALQASDFAKNFGSVSGSTVQVQATAVDAVGNIYVVGKFQGNTAVFGAVTLSRAGTYDAFAAKLDSTGSIVWAKNFGGAGASTFAQGIAVDTSGNVYLGGYFQSANLTAPALTKIGSQDSFAIKLDSAGNTQLKGPGSICFAKMWIVENTSLAPFTRCVLPTGARL